jgi:hypothetical protein
MLLDPGRVSSFSYDSVCFDGGGGSGGRGGRSGGGGGRSSSSKLVVVVIVAVVVVYMWNCRKVGWEEYLATLC